MKTLYSFALTFTFLFNLSIQAQSEKWNQYDFPYVGVKFKLPECSWRDDDETCFGVDMVNERYFNDDLSFIVGIIVEGDDEWELEDWRKESIKNGELPPTTFKNYPELEKMASHKLYFFDEDSYTMRYYFPLKYHHYLKVEIEGENSDFEEDNPIIKRFLDNLVVENPTATLESRNDEINKRQQGHAKGKISTDIHLFGDPVINESAMLQRDKDGNLYLIWVSVSKGVVVSKMTETGEKIKDFELTGDSYFFDFVVVEDGIIVATADQNIEGKDYSKNFAIEKRSFDGKKIWRTEIMPEIIMPEVITPCFVDWMFSCNLEVVDNKIAAFYPVRELTDKGMMLKGGAYSYLDMDGNLIKDMQSGLSYQNLFDQIVFNYEKNLYFFSLSKEGVVMDFHELNGTQIKIADKKVIYPFPGTSDLREVNDTRLSKPFSDGKNIFLVMSTYENVKSNMTELDQKAQDLVLIVMDMKGEVLTTKNITNTPNIDEGLYSFAEYGDNIIITWEDFNYLNQLEEGMPWRYMVIDKKGNTISPTKPLFDNCGLYLSAWTKMGHDMLPTEFVGPSNLITTKNGVAYFRFMPFYMTDHIEVVNIAK